MMLTPVLELDPLVHEAATRAFGELAREWFSRRIPREALLAAVEKLGFVDALPSADGRDAWAAAAAIIRAQARSAVPVDMALLLVTGDRPGSIAHSPTAYVCVESADRSILPAERAALSLGRCLQMVAAMAASLELSLQYVRDRKQFGQPLSKFQAIQHSLAVAAEEVAACGAIVDRTLACAAREDILSDRTSSLLDAAAVVASGAVEVVYEVCHQVHGAIGFTQEYPLHRHSLDLLRWRDHLTRLRGGDLRCAERLGDRALANGSVWQTVTSLMNLGDCP